MKYNSTEQPVIWFRDRYNSGELSIRPPYQRQPVWSAKQKCALVESILLSLPIPEIYVQHTVERDSEGTHERSAYAVVDGQQRIRTVLQFIGIDATDTEAAHNSFSLDKLENLASPLRGLRYNDLNSDQRSAFLTYKFAVRHLDTADEDGVRDIFKRINKFSTKLNDQELRNATYTGPFIQLANELADDDFWVTNTLVSPAQIRRMKDIQFVSELLIGVIHGPQGGSARIIDEYYSMYEDYDEQFPGQRTTVERFRRTKAILKDLFEVGGVSRFRTNLTDFYSLFVATAAMLIDWDLPTDRVSPLSIAIRSFEQSVDRRLADNAASAVQDVVTYVRAVEKGANDKKRRADRHEVLLTLLQRHFTKRSSPKRHLQPTN